MKNHNHLANTLRGAILLGVSVLASFSAAAWDEIGPEVSGKRQNFGEPAPRVETTTPVKQNGLWGFVAADGKVTIKPKYQEIGQPQYYENIPKFGDYKLTKALIPVKLNGLWGFVGQNGKEAIKPQYDYVGNFTTEESYNSLNEREYNGKCLVSKDGRYFFINQKGKETGSLGLGLTDVFQIDGITFGVNRGELTVLEGNKNGVHTQVYPNFYYIKTPKSEVFRSRTDKKIYSVKAFIGPKDDPIAVINAPEGGYRLLDDEILPFSTFTRYITFTQAEENGAPKFYGLYHPDNTFTCVTVGSNAKAFHTDKIIKGWFGTKYFRFYEPTDTTRCGILDAEGKVIVPATYTSLQQGKSGNIVAQKDGKFGFIAPDGKELVPFIYNEISDWGNDRICVSNGSTIGILDVSTGDWQLPLGKYSHIGKSIWNDRAVWVRNGDKWGVALAGLTKEVVPPIYDKDEISVGFKTTFDNKNFTVHIKRNGTVSVVNYYGKTIIPLGKYTGIKGYCFDYVCVKKGNKVGLVNRYTGKQIIPPVHDSIDGTGLGKIAASDRTNTGFMMYIYSEDGRLIHKQHLQRSATYTNMAFMKNWLGGLPLTFDFTL